MLVYRPELDLCDGPLRLQEVSDENCYVLLPAPSGLSKFRSTAVNRFWPTKKTAEEPCHEGYEENDNNIIQQTADPEDESANDQQQVASLTASIEN